MRQSVCEESNRIIRARSQKYGGADECPRGKGVGIAGQLPDSGPGAQTDAHFSRFRKETCVQFPFTLSFGVAPRRKSAHKAMSAVDSRRAGPMTLHSQTVSTRQPASTSACSFAASRARLPAILATQNSVRVAGRWPRGQSCPCQKQPCTKMTARYFGNTRSGRPGSPFLYSRNRNPAACRLRRSTSSGVVSRLRTRLIAKRR